MAVVIAGVDEAGRGPLAGPVVAAAVILDPKRKISGLRDSKQLSAKQREFLYEQVIAKSMAYAVGVAAVFEIDRINILQATLVAMKRAVAALPIEPELVLIDGNRAPIIPYPYKTIIRGDQLHQAISAASIVAKVVRDREMRRLDKLYPEYNFVRNKGYPTAQHFQLLLAHGLCPVHRQSFEPVKSMIIV